MKIDYFAALQKAIGRYWARGGIDGHLERVDEQGRALQLCMGVQDAQIKDSALYERGGIARPGKTVARGFPRVIEGKAVRSSTQSGRLEFAGWLTHRDHPFTPRVMANREWRHLFGNGLVRAADNFGFTGERPSHPGLLDHLALRFMDGGWSVKALIREIVDVLEHFDFATPTLATGDRDVTNVPLQALYLMNGAFVQEQATALAQRVMKEKPTESERIQRTFALCFSRPPDAASGTRRPASKAS